jgi:hypothetical protein
MTQLAMWGMKRETHIIYVLLNIIHIAEYEYIYVHVLDLVYKMYCTKLTWKLQYQPLNAFNCFRKCD